MTRVRAQACRAALCAVWVIALAPRGAAGDAATAKARADSLVADGNAAFARNDVATAAERYRAAWELAPEARIALNLGIALAELGRTAAAAEAFAIYLADPVSDPAKRRVLEQRLALWRPELGEIVLEITPASAVIEIDGARPLRNAPGARVPVTPGKHLVTARAAGYAPGELWLEVAQRDGAIARLALVATGPPASPGAVRVDRVDRAEGRPWKWIALGAGLGAAAAGGYFGAVAIADWRKVDQRCPRGLCMTPADLALADDARTAGTRANIAFAASGAALITAVLLWRFEPGRSSSPADVSIEPRASGGLLCVSGRL